MRRELCCGSQPAAIRSQPAASRSQPQSGERMQPTAQAVGPDSNNLISPGGAKDKLHNSPRKTRKTTTAGRQPSEASRKAAKECSPRRKPWVRIRIIQQAPEGRKTNSTTLHGKTRKIA